MGRLTRYLQEQFRAHCPDGWECQPEARLLQRELAAVLGYAPRADVVLLCRADGHRLWVEFEVSRADPVANHAKFATAHLFQPLASEDVFVSMVSRHIERGRRNLAANTIQLMRRVGMNAVQTVLFPELRGPEVQRLNHVSPDELRAGGPDVRLEMERAFAVSTPQGTASGHRIYLTGELVDVMLSARAWNEGVLTSAGQALWGRRSVQYFVYVPFSGAFAPSKFCAFLPVPQPSSPEGPPDLSHMTLELYAALDECESRFDGHVAQIHLTRRLGMVSRTPADNPQVAEQFRRWLTGVAGLVTVDRRGPVFLCPPEP